MKKRKHHKCLVKNCSVQSSDEGSATDITLGKKYGVIPIDSQTFASNQVIWLHVYLEFFQIYEKTKSVDILITFCHVFYQIILYKILD